MLWPQLLQPMLAEARDEMRANRGAVALVGALPDERSGDVLQPVVQPGLDSPPLGRLANPTAVAVALQLRDPVDDHCFRSGHDVASVDSAVVFEPYGHSAVPVAVLALVYRRAPVGLGRLMLPQPWSPARSSARNVTRASAGHGGGGRS